MKQAMRTVLFLLLGCLPFAGADAWAALSSNSKKRVEGGAFFIGNSYTYVNDLPAVVEGLVAAGNGKAGADAFWVDSYTKGAASLAQFLDDPAEARCREKLDKGGFKWVVLQDQSQTPAMMPQQTLRAGKAWAERAKAAKAQPVLFLTWEHAIRGTDGKFASTPRMQDKLSETYCRLAQETGAKVAPVGEAWRLWRMRHPEVTLYSQDGSHPNALGTYLSACVFYAVFTGKSPVGLPHQVRRQGGVVLQVPSAQAKQCQKVAEKVVKGFSPETFFKRLAEQDATYPTLEEVRPMLKASTSIKTLTERLGNPASRYRSNKQVFHEFLLRGGYNLQVITTDKGIEHIGIMTPEGRMEFVNLH